MNQEGRKKFRGPWDPEYRFWKRLFEKEPYIAQEFVRRIECSPSGFINWDFLPQLSYVANRHESCQYREALKFAERRIRDLLMNQSALNHLDKHHIAELRKITKVVVEKRKRGIEMNDTFLRMICDWLRGSKTTVNHKEVYELWMSIMSAFSVEANAPTSIVGKVINFLSSLIGLPNRD